MNCPKCGNEITPEMKLCAKCGASVTQPEQNREFAQPAPVAQPPKQKKDGKKNLPLKIIAIILVIAVLLTGGLFITDSILFKTEKDKGNYITDFPVLKQNTELLVYDAEKFPYEDYNIKVDRFKTGKVFKSSTFSGFENIINERSNSKIFNIDFEEDGKYQITLTGIVSERTQAVPTAPSSTTTTTAKSEEPTVITIIVIVDDDNEKAVDKVTVNSKEDDEPIKDFSEATSSGKEFEVQNITTIAAGMTHTVGLKTDGTVVATGFSEYGQCDVGDWKDIISVSAGDHFTVGLKSDGTVVSTCSNLKSYSAANSWTDIVAVAAGGYHFAGLKSDGTVVAAGDDSENNLDVGSWKNIVSVSAGEAHTVGLKADGTVVAVGLNENGQCEVSGWKDIVAVDAGCYCTVGLKSDGTIVIAGFVHPYAKQPDFSKWTDIVAVSAGVNYLLGLKSDGTVISFGWSQYGQHDVSGWSDIVAVSTAWGHSVGLKSDGTVVATGENEDGRCDVSGWKDIKVPGKVSGASKPSEQITDADKNNSAATNVKVGDYITFGKYEQDNSTSNGKEDIEWLVLDVKDGKALVISKYALDCKQYDTDASDFVGVKWEDCSLRSWLNNDFVNVAFSANEKAKIPTVTVSADKNPDYDTNPGNATQDKVFLLSITEANKYFGSDDERKCAPTDYAISQGAYMSGKAACWWWLRSPGSNQNCAAHIYDVGDIHEGGYGVRLSDIAVRPAMWIDLNS